LLKSFEVFQNFEKHFVKFVCFVVDKMLEIPEQTPPPIEGPAPWNTVTGLCKVRLAVIEGYVRVQSSSGTS